MSPSLTDPIHTAFLEFLLSVFLSFLVVLRWNTSLFYMDLLMVPLAIIRQAGLLTQFDDLTQSGDFTGDGDAVPFRDAMRDKYSIETP